MRHQQYRFRSDFISSYAIGLIGLLSIIGCGQGDRPNLGTVTGRVTLEGMPLKNVEIAFIPKEGRPSYGQTDKEGKYELNYIRDIQGAKIGIHSVLIRSGQVDKDKLEPVEVAAGENVIDIDCSRLAKPQPPSVAGDDVEL